MVTVLLDGLVAMVSGCFSGSFWCLECFSGLDGLIHSPLFNCWMRFSLGCFGTVFVLIILDEGAWWMNGEFLRGLSWFNVFLWAFWSALNL